MFWLKWIVLLLISQPLALVSRGSDEEATNNQALLLGFADYRHAHSLPSVRRDLQYLSETLVDYGGYQVTTISDRTLVDKPGARAREYVENRIARWLSSLSTDDTALLYFSGHGVRNGHGQLFLALPEFTPQSPSEAGVSVSWLRRQLESSNAGTKLLVLDACHAGAARSVETITTVPMEEIAAELGEALGVITLASCHADEKSVIWPSKDLSLFTYWLSQGLKGRADFDDDGTVTVDELYRYLDTHVPITARAVLRHTQRPVRIIGPDVIGVPVVVELTSFPLKHLLRDMAEQLATTLEIHGIETVAVFPDFDLAGVVGPREDFEQFNDYVGTELVYMLAMASGGVFEVVAPEFLEKPVPEAISEAGEMMGAFRTQIEGRSEGELAALVVGSLHAREKNVLSIQLELRGTAQRSFLDRVIGRAHLNASEVAMIGNYSTAVSLDFQGISSAEEMRQREAEQVAEQLFVPASEQQATSHPLLEGELPVSFRVRVRQGEEDAFVERPPLQEELREGRFFVPMKRGEQYEILVETRARFPVFMRLFVDGLNTLAERQRVGTKDVFVEILPENKMALAPAQRVNLSEARAWALHPPERRGESRTFVVKGFYHGCGKQYNAFEVGYAREAVASQRGYRDELGVITAALYYPESRVHARSYGEAGDEEQPGTRLGRLYETDLKAYDGPFLPGGLMAVIHLHYGFK